ncbi:cytochrome P450 [Rhodococcus sp. MSC1_016]|uniref:cytochrome P450 n=1 Tax=Rhodococcus sp. MSC1_016 TaxID=2909266 RepID=UPI00202EB875|nr:MULTISPECIES: cytochrome P450 [Rhodococcus]GLK33395.1 cytochrome P450 [Rhodococcus wratislaviensis]
MSSHIESPQIFDPLNPDHFPDPVPHLAAARERCPVSTPREGLHVLTHDSDIRGVLADTVTYSNKGNFSIEPEDVPLPFATITNADAPVHTELRNRLRKNFAPAHLRTLRAWVEGIVESAIAGLPADGEIELYERFVRVIPASVMHTFIGIPEESWAKAQDWGDIVVETVPAPLGELPEFGQLLGLLGGLVAERRARPTERSDDVLDNLCFAAPGERTMSDAEIVTHIFQLVVAGTDTTRSLIANCIWRLLEDPSRWDTVVADRTLLPNAIEESLRVDSPAQFLVRTRKVDGTIQGCPVSEGDKVYLSLQSANLDEATWGPNAGRFDPEREDAPGHVAFGRGVHACLGAPLARIEAIAAIGALMDRYPGMRLSPRATWVNTGGTITRRPREVLVALAPLP